MNGSDDWTMELFCPPSIISSRATISDQSRKAFYTPDSSPNGMEMVFIALNVCFMEVSKMLNFVPSCFIKRLCVVPLAPAVMTMIVSIF
jgi:hypothetical protein